MDQAIEIMADLISDKSDDIELRRKLAETLYKVGRYELSAEHYKNSVMMRWWPPVITGKG